MPADLAAGASGNLRRVATVAHREAHAHGLRVDSEVGTLRRVIVHRPGRELDRLTPANHTELLFDDVVWGQRAGEEHGSEDGRS